MFRQWAVFCAFGLTNALDRLALLGEVQIPITTVNVLILMLPSLRRALLALSSLVLFPGYSLAADFNLVGAEVARFLKEIHYARLPFDERLNNRVFDDYLDSLDPGHFYFLKSDVDRLSKKYRGSAASLIQEGKGVPMAKEIYEIYLQRAAEWSELVNRLLEKNQFSFKEDDFITRDREDSPWPATTAEAKILWEKQIKAAYLGEELRREEIAARAKEQGKKDPLADQESISEKITLRYKRLFESIENADEEDVANGILSALARAHDPHTEYFSPRELKQFNVDISNKLIGIGALLRAEEDGATKIEGIVNNGPADKAGELKLGDRVIGVDSKNDGNWTDIMFLPLDKVVEKIRGEEGSEVALKVEPADGSPGETRIYVIKREPVDMKEEQAGAEVIVIERPTGPVKLGVIRIPQFYFDQADRTRNVSTHVADLIERLEKEDTAGIIIDLRGNGGGSLDEVRRMTGFFNGRSPVVQVKKTTGQIETLRAPGSKPLYSGPLLILTDKGSASASEILAGALQDYNRAVIIGSANTFGKGTVQQPIPIARYARIFNPTDRAGAIKLTIQKYYRPSGSSVQIEGVVPDIKLPAVTDVLEVGEAHAKHALPHDLIRPSSDFKPFTAEHLHLKELQKRSALRVEKNQEYKYLREDRDRIKKQYEENTISLNKEKRKAENAENEARRKSRNKERRVRFAEIEEQDEKEMRIFRLSLEDLKVDKLPPLNLKDDDERHMRRAKDDLAELDDTPEWPSGIDASKREGLAVLLDLLELQKATGFNGELTKP